MKRLVNDAGRSLLNRPNTGARAQYEQHLKRLLTSDSIDSGFKEAIVSHEPKDRLVSYYLADRTKSSFQGSGDLKARVRNVLGIPNSAVTDIQLDSLDVFFTARNQIVHDLDYKESLGTSTARHHRSTEMAVTLCNAAFGIATDLVHAAAAALKAS